MFLLCMDNIKLVQIKQRTREITQEPCFRKGMHFIVHVGSNYKKITVKPA